MRAGPNNIPPLFIKRCSKALTLSLCIILNVSLETGEFLEEWKRARIVQISKSDVKNYRPISILFCFCKFIRGAYRPYDIQSHINSSLSDFSMILEVGL